MTMKALLASVAGSSLLLVSATGLAAGPHLQRAPEKIARPQSKAAESESEAIVPQTDPKALARLFVRGLRLPSPVAEPTPAQATSISPKLARPVGIGTRPLEIENADTFNIGAASAVGPAKDGSAVLATDIRVFALPCEPAALRVDGAGRGETLVVKVKVDGQWLEAARAVADGGRKMTITGLHLPAGLAVKVVSADKPRRASKSMVLGSLQGARLAAGKAGPLGGHDLATVYSTGAQPQVMATHYTAVETEKR